jgi:hypothetical protein
MIHADTLEKELNWFARVLDGRLQAYFSEKQETFEFSEIQPPELNGDVSAYSSFVSNFQMAPEERLTLILSLIPHVKPQLLDILFTRNTRFDRGFSEFGGMKGNSYSGFLPTGETALFLLAGDDLKKRIRYSSLFHPDHYFSKESILFLNHHSPGEPHLSSQLELNQDYVDLFTTGSMQRPSFSVQFPARRMESELEWEDLVLPPETMEPVMEVIAWLKNGRLLKSRFGENRHLKNGYRALFYGPPGTGKTLTAGLLGKVTNIDVYRTDLSMVVSKFIGETEKNLSRIFDRAERKNWILFFDEADALFGKRTEISDAHDRYANQEISYLLQRVEDFLAPFFWQRI